MSLRLSHLRPPRFLRLDAYLPSESHRCKQVFARVRRKPLDLRRRARAVLLAKLTGDASFAKTRQSECVTSRWDMEPGWSRWWI